MENNLINSRKVNTALILKPHKGNTKYFFKGKGEGEYRRRKKREDIKIFSLTNMSEIKK